MAEWLHKITAETSLEEIVERPSAINPYPERVVNDEYEVSKNFRMPTLGSNFHVYVRYAEDDIVRGQIPVFFGVSQEEAQPPHGMTTEEQQTYDRQWPTLTPDDEFAPMPEIIEKEYPYLAAAYIRGKGIDREYCAELAARDDGPTMEYMKFIVGTAEERRTSGLPFASFAAAESLGRNRVIVDNKRVYLYSHLRMKDGLPYLIEPGFHTDPFTPDPSDPFSMVPKEKMNEYLEYCGNRDAVGENALLLLERHMKRRALGAIATAEVKLSVAEKMKALEADLALDIKKYAGILATHLSAVPEFARTKEGLDLDPEKPEEFGRALVERILL